MERADLLEAEMRVGRKTAKPKRGCIVPLSQRHVECGKGDAAIADHVHIPVQRVSVPAAVEEVPGIFRP